MTLFRERAKQILQAREFHSKHSQIKVAPMLVSTTQAVFPMITCLNRAFSFNNKRSDIHSNTESLVMNISMFKGSH